LEEGGKGEEKEEMEKEVKGKRRQWEGVGES